MNKDNINEFASFDEYLRQGEPSQKESAENWKTAIGLQAVDDNFINKEGEENVPSSSQACPKFVPSSSQVEELIIRINKDYLSIGDIMNLFGLKNRTRFRKEYITPALAEGALEMKYPNIPRHPRQQYRMTELAKTWKEGYEKKNK